MLKPLIISPCFWVNSSWCSSCTRPKSQSLADRIRKAISRKKSASCLQCKVAMESKPWYPTQKGFLKGYSVAQPHHKTPIRFSPTSACATWGGGDGLFREVDHINNEKRLMAQISYPFIAGSSVDQIFRGDTYILILTSENKVCMLAPKGILTL